MNAHQVDLNEIRGLLRRAWGRWERVSIETETLSLIGYVVGLDGQSVTVMGDVTRSRWTVPLAHVLSVTSPPEPEEQTP